MACAAKKMRPGTFVFRYICPDFPIESNGEEVAAVAEKRERIRRRSGGQEAVLTADLAARTLTISCTGRSLTRPTCGKLAAWRNGTEKR